MYGSGPGLRASYIKFLRGTWKINAQFGLVAFILIAFRWAQALRKVLREQRIGAKAGP